MAAPLRPPPSPPPPPGLCETCANVKVVETRKGSRFYLCTLSEVDPRFPKYPRIPVVRCIGYVPAPGGESVGAAAAGEGEG
ncbi:MAG TPA: hypothetical protein VF746_23535 [Longimicrobium sp.]